MQTLPEALQPLAAYPQFILYEQTDQKRPVAWSNEHNRWLAHDPHDPAIWMTFDVAAQLAAAYGHGVGFVFTENDPFFFLDIDKALSPAGQWSELATNLCSAFAGCAVEISRSGTGLHIFGQATAIPHSCKNIPLGIEFYTSGRYVALTGTGATGSAAVQADALVQWLVDSYFAPKDYDADGFEWTEEPVVEWSGPEDDDALLEKMLKSSSASNAFSNRASVRQLWEGDADALAAAYPASGEGEFDRSSADAALCQHLAFWTGKDCERIDRLFRRSALLREKWEDREDYRRATVCHAVSLCRNVLGSKQAAEKAAQVEAGVEAREGYQYLTLTQQLEHFAGCVYVRDLHAVYVPDGGLLDQGRFKAAYGGFSFAVDTVGGKETKNAWEAFTESQAYDFPKAHGVCFRPERAQGEIIEEEGRRLVNTYTPVVTEAHPGDVSRFLQHLAAVLPDERDQTVLLSYMAAVVQYPGVKFQWAPLLQGVEGNGKTLFIRCLSHAVGHRYTHLPNAADLGGNGTKFNAWIQGRMFIGIEEIYVSDKRELTEALKPLITNDRIEVQGKGADQITGDNRANFMLCSNHKDALIKTRNDRRYCVFYTAQQTDEDMLAAGWINASGEPTRYFSDLYEWARGGGYAAVNHFLQTYAIPDQLNPATLCQRAPVTSSTGEALKLSLGRIEQEVLEAIEEGRIGFAGGWISSTAFDMLLENRRDEKRIPPNKRRELLQSLGYDYHPALRDGRVNTASAIDGGKKPRLYIQKGGLLGNITNAADILKRYTDAQQGITQAEEAFSNVKN